MDEQHPPREDDPDSGPAPVPPASPVAPEVPAAPEVPVADEAPVTPTAPATEVPAAAPDVPGYPAAALPAATPDAPAYTTSGAPYPAPGAAAQPAPAYPAPGAQVYPGPDTPVYPAPGASPYPAPAPGASPYPASGGSPYPASGGPEHPGAAAPESFDPAAPESFAPAAPEPPRRRRSVGAIVTICLLSVGLVLALGAGGWLVYEFLQAKELISDQQQEIEDQREMIEQKEEFGAAMSQLLDTTQKFDGALTGSIVPWATYERYADQAYTHRREPERLARDVASINAENIKLEQVWSIAQQELATNATGTEYEAVIDRLGGGLVSSVIDNDLCGGTEEALGCVHGDDPYLVHFGATGHAEPYMTDYIRTGIAYHEFAHVLQYTNPTETDEAVKAFDGDYEVMADCYAFAYLPGWSLDHTVWVSDYEYWEVSVGYGVTCTEEQRQVIRGWNDSLGVELQTIGG